MKVLNEEMYGLRMSVNDKININNMSDNAKEFYFTIYSFYMHLFYQYIIKKTDIINYDNVLKSNGYQMVDDNDKDFYQMFSGDFLKFFYIRNNLYLDRLSNSDISFLGEKLKTGDFTLSKECEDFIERTYGKLVFENVSGNYDSNFDVNFGPNNVKFYAPVNSIVFGVRCADELIDGNDNKSVEDFLVKRNYVEQICVDISKKFSSLFPLPVSVICYDSNSVKKKHSVDNLHIR